MKVLYVGYYKEFSDWGKVTVNNILALDSAGVDVVCRPITFSVNQTPVSIQKFEEASLEGCDVCIQHLFPNHMLATGEFKKNIGILANEFLAMDHSSWVERLVELDEIWVPSQVAKNCIKNKEILEKTKVVPFAFSTDKFTSSSPSINLGPEVASKFKFYTILEKQSPDVERILKCFHSEFDVTEEAALVIQVDGDDTGRLDEYIGSVKKSLALHKDISLYQKDLIVNKEDQSQESDNLHQVCDCYVSCSTTRTLSLNEFDALGFGNTPIVMKNTDIAEYVGEELAVDSILHVKMGENSLWRDTNNSKDYILVADEQQIKQKMRERYEEWKRNPPAYSVKKKQEGLQQAQKFSIKSVGSQMKEALNV